MVGEGGSMNGAHILSLLLPGCVTSTTLLNIFAPRCFPLEDEDETARPPAGSCATPEGRPRT